jgi:hypothetical protein
MTMKKFGWTFSAPYGYRAWDKSLRLGRKNMRLTIGVQGSNLHARWVPLFDTFSHSWRVKIETPSRAFLTFTMRPVV